MLQVPWRSGAPQEVLATATADLADELLDRVLLEPAEQLKAVPDLRRKLQNLEALRDLFRLDQGKP